MATVDFAGRDRIKISHCSSIEGFDLGGHEAICAVSEGGFPGSEFWVGFLHAVCHAEVSQLDCRVKAVGAFVKVG